MGRLLAALAEVTLQRGHYQSTGLLHQRLRGLAVGGASATFCKPVYCWRARSSRSTLGFVCPPLPVFECHVARGAVAALC